MTLDVRGGLKKARYSMNNYVFIDELFANAIDSFLIRKHLTKDVQDFKFELDVSMYDKTLDKERVTISVVCSDNGIGLGKDQRKAFVTKDTSYKDDLKIEGIAKCKGSGRIQYLLYFEEMDIESHYFEGNEVCGVSLNFDVLHQKEINESDFNEFEGNEEEIGFKIELVGLKAEALESIYKVGDAKQDYRALAIKNHVLTFFLRRLISLKTQLGNFEINFSSTYDGKTEKESISLSDLPDVTSSQTVKVEYKVDDKRVDLAFQVSHYKLSNKKFVLRKNTVAMCARSAIVLDITNRFLKTKSLENRPVDENYHVILIESDFLDSNVNEQRNDFNIVKRKKDLDQATLFEEQISKEEIFDKLDPVIINMLKPPGWKREDIVKIVASKYGISSSMIKEAKVRISYGDTEDTVVKRVMEKLQEKIIEDTSEIFDIKTKIQSLNPDSKDFREQVNKLSWMHTSSLKSVDMVNLSQLVVRRAAIVEVLSLAVKKDLECQKDDGRQKNEALIHNIFFPMKKDSSEVRDHDIWLLNEEYHYYDYIASDKDLASFTLPDHGHLFEQDIDNELRKVLKKNSDNNARKRPDIAIFNKEGAAIIIEFKAPGVSMDDHIGDLMEYSQLLAAKSNGRIKKFYGYLIGDTVNPNRLRGYTRFPSGDGWFGTETIIEHDTGASMGQLYSEILYYEDIIKKASGRLDVYKRKLALDF